MIFRKLPLTETERAITTGDEIQGILVGITEKNTWSASLEASEDIGMVFMALVKDFHVKMRLGPLSCVNLIKYSMRLTSGRKLDFPLSKLPPEPTFCVE